MTDSQPSSDLLILFGDFNCPFSALASERAEAIEAAGLARIEWRAVQHLPDQPRAGLAVEGELAAMFEDEVSRIRDLLAPSEDFPLKVPAVQPSTALATAAFASASDRRATRRRIFHAFWLDGRDIGDPEALEDLGATIPQEPPALVDGWQGEWESFDRRMVPMMRMPDGYTSRGLGALERLARMLL